VGGGGEFIKKKKNTQRKSGKRSLAIQRTPFDEKKKSRGYRETPQTKGGWGVGGSEGGNGESISKIRKNHPQSSRTGKKNFN